MGRVFFQLFYSFYPLIDCAPENGILMIKSSELNIWKHESCVEL